jgi:hypothetical protein
MFDNVLLEAVDEGLLVLGTKARHEIYKFLERTCQVKREEIPERLEAFQKTLQTIFGLLGAKNIEKIVIRRLYERLGSSPTNEEDWTLIDHVDYCRKLYERR